jgi:hypothetical protein
LVWPSSREEGSQPIDKLWQRPPRTEADWIKGGPMKEGLYYISGPRKGLFIAENWEFHCILGEHETVIRFNGSATTRGREMARRCANSSVQMQLSDGSPQRVAGAPLTVWKITTMQEQGGFGPYWVPVPEMLGKLGEAAGPSFAEWQELERRRVELQEELVAGGMPLLAMHTPEKMLEDRAAKRSSSRDHTIDDDFNPPAPPVADPAAYEPPADDEVSFR